MTVWLGAYEPQELTEGLYQRCLKLVDEKSAARIKRFYHRADAWRGLIGQLMIRMTLKERGVSLSQMAFSATESGKPYVTNSLQEPLAYNLSHDNALIALFSGIGSQNPPAFSLGIDVMKVELPTGESYRSFVETFVDQLSEDEQSLIHRAETDDGRLELFFWMWTLKEAYTKALGLGLGFDFKRVSFDPLRNFVLVDKKPLEGWTFQRFKLSLAGGTYVGVTAEFHGRSGGKFHPTVNPEDAYWIKVETCLDIAQRAIEVLE